MPETRHHVHAYLFLGELVGLYKKGALPTSHPARQQPDRDEKIADLLRELAAEVWEGMTLEERCLVDPDWPPCKGCPPSKGLLPQNPQELVFWTDARLVNEDLGLVRELVGQVQPLLYADGGEISTTEAVARLVVRVKAEPPPSFPSLHPDATPEAE